LSRHARWDNRDKWDKMGLSRSFQGPPSGTAQAGTPGTGRDKSGRVPLMGTPSLGVVPACPVKSGPVA